MDCQLSIVRKLGALCGYCRPHSQLAKRAKKEEEGVAAFLTKKDIMFHREVVINYNCFTAGDNKKFARLDFVLELPDKRVILEVDEHQHKSVTYSVACDLARMSHVVSAIRCGGDTRGTLWVRFNPNAHHVDGKLRHIPKARRYETLCERVVHHCVDEGAVRILYMFYDEESGTPIILRDPDYDANMRNLVNIVGS